MSVLSSLKLELEEDELLMFLFQPRYVFLVRSTISPALEAAIGYQLKILSVGNRGITYGDPALLSNKEQLKEAIYLAFDSPPFWQGDEKEYLKVTLLRVESSLQGLFSCLPDFVPDCRNGMVDDQNHIFLMAGATCCTVGTTALQENATEIVHAACKLQ